MSAFDLAGRKATVRRDVTALRPTREWTGTAIWSGTITGGLRRDGALAAVCVMTEREHTWLALGEWSDTMRDGEPCRRWVTSIELSGSH